MQLKKSDTKPILKLKPMTYIFEQNNHLRRKLSIKHNQEPTKENVDHNIHTMTKYKNRRHQQQQQAKAWLHKLKLMKNWTGQKNKRLSHLYWIHIIWKSIYFGQSTIPMNKGEKLMNVCLQLWAILIWAIFVGAFKWTPWTFCFWSSKPVIALSVPPPRGNWRSLRSPCFALFEIILSLALPRSPCLASLWRAKGLCTPLQTNCWWLQWTK